MSVSYRGSALLGEPACEPTRSLARTLQPAGARQRTWAGQGACRRRCRRRHAAVPAALFGFGKQEEVKAAPPPAAPESGPLLVPFTPIQKTADYSLRLYSAYAVAETVYERRDEGFLVLGTYMSGNNADGVRCRETQPAVMCYDPKGPKRMRVHIVPRSGGSTADAGALPPAAKDPAVSLTIAGGEVVAAGKFEGNATQEACERCRRQLVAALERDGLGLAEAEAEGYFRLAQYGPLHSLQTRTNEIWLAVKL